VLETGLGVLGFAGRFGRVAPTAFRLRGLLGYEFTSWLMVFGDGELAFTDTSESLDESHSAAFPIWGFSGGVRGTVHATERVAVSAQGSVGELTAVVPHGGLAFLGFRRAEALNLQYGGRLGVEWYQTDRHLAFELGAGARLAQGFERAGPPDTPLMWDADVGLRYTF
jgi:hypothetical protein